MDSKLVVEQMSGRWQIKDGNLRHWPPPRGRQPAAWAAASPTPGCPAPATPALTGWPTRPWTWRLLARRGRGLRGRPDGRPQSAAAPTMAPRTPAPARMPGMPAAARRSAQCGQRLGPAAAGTAHGDAAAAAWPDAAVRRAAVRRPRRRSADRRGREQAAAAAARLGAARWHRRHRHAHRCAGRAGRREAVAEATHAPLLVDDDLAEADFGKWEGLTFAEAGAQWPEEMAAWLASADAAPPGGESFATVAAAGAVRAGADCWTHHAGRTAAARQPRHADQDARVPGAARAARRDVPDSPRCSVAVRGRLVRRRPRAGAVTERHRAPAEARLASRLMRSAAPPQ